jgi:hypothetical protein
MGADGLIPSIPDDIMAARIGACYDQFSQKLIPGAYAILPSLAGSDQVVFVSGRGNMTVTANSSSSAAATSTIFQLDTKASGGYDTVAVGVGGSVDFHMEQAKATSHQDENLNVTCYYAFTGQRQLLRKMDADELYSIMTDSFKHKYDEVVNAEAEEYPAKYQEFVREFGHGCVTAVHLAAGSAFRMTLTRQDNATTTRRKYGGSASLSGHYGGGYAGASVAADWAQDHQTADAQTTLDIQTDSLPQNAPTADWVNNMLNNFVGVTLNALTEKANTIEPPASVEPVKAPEPPHGVPDKSKSPDKPKADPSDKGVSEALQDQIMKDDDWSGSWDEYKAAQQKLLDSISPTKVVEETNQLSGGTR